MTRSGTRPDTDPASAGGRGPARHPQALTDARRPRPGRRAVLGRIRSWLAGVGVLVALGAALAASATRYVDVGPALPSYTAPAGAAVVTTVLCGLLAHRLGAHTVVAATFAAVTAAGAVVTGWGWLLAGVTALTAFAATVLAVVATRPARRPLPIVREYAVAIGVALVGAVAVGAYAAPLRPTMLGHVVLLAALVATLWVAHRLADGVRGLGRRGVLVIACAVIVLVIGLAYGEALRRWGSPGLIEAVDSLRALMVDVFGAVPRPLELFIGLPALVWGLATRARLRQGWWVTAFGCLGTAGVATSLAGVAQPGQALLSTLYTVLAGLVLGLLVWRVDQLLTGPRGRRARVSERAWALRPEPSRTRPLL